MSREPLRPPATIVLMPAVVNIVGGIVGRPEDTDTAAIWLADLLANAPASHRFAVMDAAVLIAQTLRDAYEQVAGMPAPDARVLTVPDELSANSAAGMRDAHVMIMADCEGANPASWPDYYAGNVNDGRLVAAFLTCCNYTAQLVDMLAAITGNTAGITWRKISPILR